MGDVAKEIGQGGHDFEDENIDEVLQREDEIPRMFRGVLTAVDSSTQSGTINWHRKLLPLSFDADAFDDASDLVGECVQVIGVAELDEDWEVVAVNVMSIELEFTAALHEAHVAMRRKWRRNRMEPGAWTNYRLDTHLLTVYQGRGRIPHFLMPDEDE